MPRVTLTQPEIRALLWNGYHAALSEEMEKALGKPYNQDFLRAYWKLHEVLDSPREDPPKNPAASARKTP